ncbi:MAG: hypothetical protein B6241_05365 [Spirochaetaceae bacterium 4572_59]|nr:MAG: hypothetical protein B6241_05365 [Spirochaetaceae bacterium 4572_59]
MSRPPIVIFIPLLFFLGACGEKPPEESSVGEDSYVPVVKLLPCHSKAYSRTYETYGTVAYLFKADVCPMSSEIIKSIPFEEGDRVRKGEILARLNSQKLEIQMKEARAGVRIKETGLNLALQQLEEGRRNMEAQFLTIENSRLDLEKTEADFERMTRVYANKKQLYNVEGISREEMDSVELEYFEKELNLRQSRSNLAVKLIGYRDEDLLKAGYLLPETDEEKTELFVDYNTRTLQAQVDVAQAELEAVRSQMETLKLYLAETAVRAPIDGLIAQKYMEEGEKASPDKPLYMIYPDKSVYAVAQLSEKDISLLRPGMEAEVKTDITPTMRRGVIQRISPWIQKESRTASLKILLDNEDALFRVGQFVRIKVLLSEAVPTLMIPEEAVLSEGEISYAFSYRGGRIFRQDLVCGEESDEELPVFEGLEEGTRIVLNPRSSYKNGMEVRLP